MSDGIWVVLIVVLIAVVSLAGAAGYCNGRLHELDRQRSYPASSEEDDETEAAE